MAPPFSRAEAIEPEHSNAFRAYSLLLFPNILVPLQVCGRGADAHDVHPFVGIQVGRGTAGAGHAALVDGAFAPAGSVGWGREEHRAAAPPALPRQHLVAAVAIDVGGHDRMA